MYNIDYHKALSSSDRLMIFPVVFHGFPPRLRAALEAAIFSAVIPHWKPHGISMWRAKRSLPYTGFGSLLEWQLAHAVQHVVSRHRSVRLEADRCRPWMRPMVTRLPKLIAWAKGALWALGARVPKGYQPHFLVVTHVDRIASFKGGVMMRYRVLVAIVDAQTRQVVAATSYHQYAKVTKAAMVAKLGSLGKWSRKAFKPVFKP